MPRAAWKARRRRARSSSKSTAASALDAASGDDDASSEPAPVEATDALALNTSATSTLARGRGRRGRDGSSRLISGGVNFGGGGGRGRRRAAGGSSTGAEESFDAATDADADADDDADVDANVWERARANHPSRKHPLVVVVVARTLDVTRDASLTRRISRASQSKVRFAIRCAAPSDFDSGFLQRQKDDRTDGCADERAQQAR